MQRERVCPICGRMIERRLEARSDGSVYGAEMDFKYVCESPECGFSVSFPFEGGVYTACACEEIRRRTSLLPTDERADALLKSIAYCKRNGEDALSLDLKKEIEGIFYEALGGILRDARGLLRALAHREPDAQKKREFRKRLKMFFDFIEKMEGRFPTPKLETEFYAIRDGLIALDSAYELGMLALESDTVMAEDYFESGISAGGIRSRVAYAKYILSDRAETAEELSELKETFRLLAAESQEACYEYIHRAEIGVDDLVSVFAAYEEKTYPSLSIDGKLSFLHLEISACIEVYEPVLASLVVPAHTAVSDTEQEDFAEIDSARIERILSELSLLIDRISEQNGMLLGEEERRRGIDAGDSIFKQLMLEEGNALLSYATGCVMYYTTAFDLEKRFDIHYLRVAIGHFDAFLHYGSPSIVGLSSIEQIRENAITYREILSVCAGLGGEV